MKGGFYMLAVNYSTMRSKFKNYCDEATENNETVIVTRKNEKNIVIMSLEQYNNIMKMAHNSEYLNMIDRGIEQLSSGKGQVHDLIEVEDDE